MFDHKSSNAYKASWSEFADKRKSKQAEIPTVGPENLYRVLETRDEQVAGFPVRPIMASNEMMSFGFKILKIGSEMFISE